MTKARYIARPIHTSDAPRTSPRESDKQQVQISKEGLGRITHRLTDPEKESRKSAKLQASILMLHSHTYPGPPITAILQREKPPEDPPPLGISKSLTIFRLTTPPAPPTRRMTDTGSSFTTPTSTSSRAKGINVQCHLQAHTSNSFTRQTTTQATTRKAHVERRLRRRFSSIYTS